MLALTKAKVINAHLFTSVLPPFYYQKKEVMMPYSQHTQNAESALRGSQAQTEPDEKLRHLERALSELIKAVAGLERE